MYENLISYDRRKEPGFHVAKGLRFLLGESNYQISQKDCGRELTVYDCKIAIHAQQFGGKCLFLVSEFIFDDTIYNDITDIDDRIMCLLPRPEANVPYLVQLLTRYMRTYDSGKTTIPISNKSVAFSKDEFLAPVATQLPLSFTHFIYSDIIDFILFASREDADQSQLEVFLHETKNEVVATARAILANDAAESEEDQQSMATYQTVFTHPEGAAEALELSSMFRK